MAGLCWGGSVAVWTSLIAVAGLSVLGGGIAQAQESAEEFKIGLILVGPFNDAGWSQAHFEGVEYVTEQMEEISFDYVDKVNPADRPNVQGSQVADDLIAQGADLIIFNSDDFKDDALATAAQYPDIPIIHASGDMAWPEGQNYAALPNLTNIMPQMEYGRMISGCAAALGSETGKIGFLGPLINDETRRYVSAAYLGARHCWETYRDRDPSELEFRVVWIGFWFNIPGVTLDPTQVADDFYNNDFDVVLSGLDTPEAAVQGLRAAAAGADVSFLHYGLRSGCDLAPEICLGTPYYNWGPSYRDAVMAARSGEFEGEFVWAPINWEDINDIDTSSVGFSFGEALGEATEPLEQFIAGLASGEINLYQGPLEFQDGTPFLAAGEEADLPKIWYMPQLLMGIDGPSE